MNSSRDVNEKLRTLLRQAHREKEAVDVEDLPTESLMRRIREAGPFPGASLFLEIFEPFVWRLAPVLCLFILVLTVLLFTLDFTSGHDPFQLFMNGKEEITLAQLFEF